ncbi:hypothetical protein OH768_24250 [Streptomyces sp. NBC_01622]|uniref:hypothetical protein n=1 Tax=Streptomyces sp. NBC_01622 TaxID=2975903 RepID=UPI00386AE1B3|nr:hypothetical protein OH768_24250 [Streptomyces sp. NBC_01622]
MTALAMSPTTARPRRAVLRLHRPALIVWGAYVLLAVGALLWVHLFRAPSLRHSVDPYFVMTDVNNVMNFLGETLSYTSVAVAAWAGAAVPLTAGTTLLGLVYAWVRTGDQDVLVTNWSYDRVLVPSGPLSVALVLLALAAGTLAGAALALVAAFALHGRRTNIKGTAV